jgi:choline dehydrogenase-like flavoprotein
VAGEEISRRSSYDYVIVGSGTGGGAPAYNLAKAAHWMLLLEAGGDHDNYNYQVPVLNGLATEDEDLRWDYYFRHYASDERQRRDSKFVPDRDGVLYPGVGTLGGCTVHNAMNGPVARRVSVEKESKDPDLFLFDLPCYFKGYYTNYPKEVGREKNHFTWAILKAHTLNIAGKLTLRSDDPRAVPHINFHSFDEGNDTSGDDLEALVEGLKFVRRIMGRTGEVVEKESVPGKRVSTREQLREFIRNEAWGHHASSTCKMGLKED